MEFTGWSEDEMNSALYIAQDLIMKRIQSDAIKESGWLNKLGEESKQKVILTLQGLKPETLKLFIRDLKKKKTKNNPQ